MQFTRKRSILGVDYIVRHRPLSEVGGDIYSLDEIRPATIRILLADTTGHIDQYIIPLVGDILSLLRTWHLIGLKSQSNFKNIEYNLHQRDNLFEFFFR